MQATPTSPQAPGSLGTASPAHPRQPAAQDSLQDIRADLDHSPGGLTSPDPADQHALTDAVPHDEDGTPQRFPDPFGPWTQLQNDGGPTVTGRSNNCADCSRSFLETWYGNPQVSASRTADTDADGNPDTWSPETDANENQIRWTGATHTYAGPGGDPDTAAAIADTLRQAGPGSAAIVQVDWPGGGGHAYNAVNHDGAIVWIDTQSGQVSHQPLHIDQAEHVWHIPLDADRNPIDTSRPQTEATGNSEGSEGSKKSAQQTDTSPQDTDDSSHGHQDQQTTTDPAGDNTDRVPNQNTTDAPSHPDPLPATATRDTTPPGGVTHPTLAEQDALDNAVPRDENGDPTRPPNSTDGPWAQHINGTGTDTPDHNKNPADVALPTVDTYAGNPTADAASPPEPNPDSTPSDRDRTETRPTPAAPAGQQPHDFGEQQAGLQPHPDDGHPRLERERGDVETLRSGLPPDDAQAAVRVSNPVFRLQHGHVDQKLAQWAENGDLAHVLKVASGQSVDPLASSGQPRTFTADNLNKALPGFSSLNRGERMLVISTLARLSHSAHEQYGVSSNPMSNGNVSEGVAKHRRISQSARKLMETFGNPTKHKPDLTQRNFAVVEIEREDGTVGYVTDSSFPSRKGVTGRHSERHLTDWIQEVNQAHRQTGHKYKITSLYTEREPCGNKKGGLRSANCSNLLSNNLAGVPVYYSTTYRADQAMDTQRVEFRKELQEKHRNELGLTSRQPLPKQVRRDIERQVRGTFPPSIAETERDQEIENRVDKIKNLWKVIAPQL